MQENSSKSCGCGYIEAELPGYYRDIPTGYSYFIQLGVFPSYDKATELQLEFMKTGLGCVVERRDKLYMVYTGGYYDMEKAVVMEQQLRYMGYQTMIVTKEQQEK